MPSPETPVKIEHVIDFPDADVRMKIRGPTREAVDNATQLIETVGNTFLSTEARQLPDWATARSGLMRRLNELFGGEYQFPQLATIENAGVEPIVANAQ